MKLNHKLALLLAGAVLAGSLTGCGASSSTAAGSTAASSAASEVSSEEADEMAAKNVADLIDAIYVQERNENTDAQCGKNDAEFTAAQKPRPVEDEVDFIVDVRAFVVGELRIEPLVHQEPNPARRVVVTGAHG